MYSAVVVFSRARLQTSHLNTFAVNLHSCSRTSIPYKKNLSVSEASDPSAGMCVSPLSIIICRLLRGVLQRIIR
uniref:Uncharacterized protein n=1 Tax=Anguilla anguilla TaxID=7936 RepID=A0A0E9W3W6_ANGAN